MWSDCIDGTAESFQRVLRGNTEIGSGSVGISLKELHAHLHGCIRGSTIEELYRRKFGSSGIEKIQSLLNGKRTLSEYVLPFC